jgi:hypothetical protein
MHLIALHDTAGSSNPLGVSGIINIYRSYTEDSSSYESYKISYSRNSSCCSSCCSVTTARFPYGIFLELVILN